MEYLTREEKLRVNAFWGENGFQGESWKTIRAKMDGWKCSEVTNEELALMKALLAEFRHIRDEHPGLWDWYIIPNNPNIVNYWDKMKIAVGEIREGNILLEPIYQISLNVIENLLDCHERCEEEMKEWQKGDMTPKVAISNLPEGPLKKEMERLYKDILESD